MEGKPTTTGPTNSNGGCASPYTFQLINILFASNLAAKVFRLCTEFIVSQFEYNLKWV